MKMSTRLIYIFALLILFVIYFLAMYSNLTPEAVRDDFRERLYAADLALTLEAVQAVPRDMTLRMHYYLPEGLSARITPHSALVFGETEASGESFDFTINPEYSFPGNTVVGEHIRVVRRPGVVEFPESYGVNVDDVLCPDVVSFNKGVSVDPRGFPAAADFVVSTFSTVDYSESSSGGVYLKFLSAPKGVRIYVKDEIGKGIGCRIMKSFLRNDRFADINVIPVHGDIFSKQDPRHVLSYSGSNIIVAFDPDMYSEFVIANAVNEGLSAYDIE